MAKARKKAEGQAAQGDLLSVDERQPLEPVPYDFHYVVQYKDEPKPRRLKVIDWEINQTWRKWRHLYPDAVERVRDKWLDDLTGSARQAWFMVGNQKRFRDQFLLLSVYSPPKS